MPLPAHNRYTFSGVFGTVSNPAEEWSFSLKTPLDLDSTGVDLALLADGLRTTYEANIAPLVRPDVILTRCRYSAHGPDGLTLVNNSGEYIQGDNEVPLPGLAGGIPGMPLSTALVVTLLSTRAGATGKGRFFLPWPAQHLDTSYRLSVASTEAMADAMAEFVRDLNLVGEPVSVVSSKGYSSPVRAVKVGRVPDTLRSRRRGLDEAYVERAL